MCAFSKYWLFVTVSIRIEEPYWRCRCSRYGPGRQSRQQSLHKLGQLQQSIAGWEGRDIVANCSEIVFEGKLKVGSFQRKL